MKQTLKFSFIILLACMVSDSVFSQDSNQPLEDKIASNPTFERNGEFFTLNIENDSFGGSGDDNNYTSGVRISYHDADLNIPQWAHDLGEVYPGFRINDTTALTYSIGQNLYTPNNITSTIPDPNDRPYAGWLYGSIGLSTIADNRQDNIEFSLGVVGPAALGKPTQNFIHNHVFADADNPQGWDSQLKNEIGLILSWEREYPHLWSKDIDEAFNLSVTPFYGVSLGNVYTLAQIGVGFRLSPHNKNYADLPARVRPSIPGTGYFPKQNRKFEWGVFGGITGYGVAQNIFLDGNTFETSPKVSKKPFIYDVSFGFDAIYSSTRLSYTLTHRSKEFDTQNDQSIFGALSLTRRF